MAPPTPILSVSSWKCDFLRKTVIHSSCLSQDAKSSERQIHQSLGKPTITTEHSGGDLVNETADFPPHVLSFSSVKFTLQAWGGRQSKPGTQEGVLSGKVQGPKWRCPQLPAKVGPLWTKTSPTEIPGIASDYVQMKINSKSVPKGKEISHYEWK